MSKDHVQKSRISVLMTVNIKKHLSIQVTSVHKLIKKQLSSIYQYKLNVKYIHVNEHGIQAKIKKKLELQSLVHVIKIMT